MTTLDDFFTGPRGKIDLAATAFVGSALSLSQTTSGGNTVAQVLSAGAVVETFVFAVMNRPLPPARMWLIDRLLEAGRL